MSKLKEFVEAVDEQLELKDTVCVPADIAIVARNVAAGMLEGARKGGSAPRKMSDDPKAEANRKRVRRFRSK